MVATDKKKILVIDDSSTNNLLFQSILEDEGYTVVEASTGKAAFKLISSTNPDLILLDIMMPGMTGFEVLAKLKTDGDTKDIPVIMVTAKQNRADINKAKELGAFDYIKKPIIIDDLLKRIQLAL